MVSVNSCHSANGEVATYKPLVDLCNETLHIIHDQKTDLATELNMLFKPEPSHRIEFVRYENIHLAYDWLSEISVRPDVLIVIKDAIDYYKNDQTAAKRIQPGMKDAEFNPGDRPLADGGSKVRIGLKDVLGCIEMKRQQTAANGNDSTTSQNSGYPSGSGCSSQLIIL